MKARLLTLIAAVASLAHTWAVASVLPAYDTFSQAGAVTSAFSTPPNTILAYDQSYTPGVTASINSVGYAASASSSLGSNHAYSSYNGLEPNNWVTGRSNWFDQLTIGGGSGTGTATFTVQLHGSADVGGYGGIVGYQLGTSNQPPSSGSNPFAILPSSYDPNLIAPLINHRIEFKPYSNPVPTDACPSFPGGIPAIWGTPCTPHPRYDQTFGTGLHEIDLLLTGSFDFTYGDPFYLVGQLDATTNDFFFSFGGFKIPLLPPPDGTGPTTLDFSNSAVLTQITLPEGATLDAASGTAYDVRTVPLPATWALMLPGLGLLGWHARKKNPA